MTSSKISKLAARIERWPIAGTFTISRGAKTEAVTVVAEVSRGGHDRPRRMRALSPLWRDAGGDAGRARGHAGGRSRGGLDAAGPAGRHAARRRPQRAGLRPDRPRGQDAPAGGPGACSDRPAPASLHHRLHDLAGHARGDGGGDRQGGAPAAAQDQARRRRRPASGSRRCARPRPNPS